MVALQQKYPADEKISDSNEVEILQFLIESIYHHLENFGTQLEKLEEQLADGFYSSGGNAWAAAQVSLGEQKVLRLAKKSAEDLLAAVESGRGSRRALSATAQCANCKKVSEQLKLCARCNAVMYCGRTCQVAHYKEHKATCLATTRGKETD
jgi:MYND finger/Rubisco LSMT substrate-binding